MTTVAQVRQMFRPIVNNHPYLRETEVRFYNITPISHLVSGLFIERSYDKDYFSPYMIVTSLFRPRANIYFANGNYVNYINPIRSKSWIWSDPESLSEAIEMIETVALPKLMFYGTVEGYASLPVRDHWIHYEPREDRMLVHIAMGDLDTARQIWREREPVYRDETFHPQSLQHRWQGQLAAVAEPLHAGDRPALARILHDWEAANVRRMKIERYWEPTPFPLEL